MDPLGQKYSAWLHAENDCIGKIGMSFNKLLAKAIERDIE